MVYGKTPGSNGNPTVALNFFGFYVYLLLQKTILKYWYDLEYNTEVFTKLGSMYPPDNWKFVQPKQMERHCNR